MESELFGHERGAFTGALARRQGRFELAHQGTLFLDEVGELPKEQQAKLLRVLQERSLERVGGAQAIQVDVRIVAASNRDLTAAVEEGAFRADLFYRLSVFPIHVPPLRERPEDIPTLVRHFAARYASRAGKHIDDVDRSTLDRLSRYAWPGNVRELQNVVERAVILCRGSVPTLPDPVPGARADPPPRSTLAEVEKAHVQAILNSTSGRIEGPRGAAEILGLRPSTLRNRMRRIGIDMNQKR